MLRPIPYKGLMSMKTRARSSLLSGLALSSLTGCAFLPSEMGAPAVRPAAQAQPVVLWEEPSQPAREADSTKPRAHVSAPQSAVDAAPARRGCVPTGQEKGSAWHASRLIAPGVAVVVPAGQARHVVLLVCRGWADQRPCGHASHGRKRPAVLENVPAGQSMGCGAPPGQYVPGPHGLPCAARTVEPTGVVDPAGQK
jgi:hypothetical protein